MITYRKEEKVPSLAEACMASRSRRFAEVLIDLAFICFLFIPVAVIYVLKKSPEIPSPEYTAFVQKSQYGGSLFVFLYYFVCEAFFGGKTLGKLILGTRTVTMDGERPDVRAIALRTLCRAIPVVDFSILFGNYWDKGVLRGNWYDKISGTYVVKDSLAAKYRAVYGRTRTTRSSLEKTPAPSQMKPAQAVPAPAQAVPAPEAPKQPDFRAGDKVRHRYAGFQTVVTSVLPDGTVSTPEGDFSPSHIERI